jgi:hypothetical protein
MKQPSPFHSNNRFYNNISILNCQYISLHARTIFYDPSHANRPADAPPNKQFYKCSAGLREGSPLCHGAEATMEKAYSLAHYQSIQ